MADKSMQDYLERIEDDFVTENDGFEVFWPEGDHGYYDAAVLRAIADELDKRNGPWKDQLEEWEESCGPDFGDGPEFEGFADRTASNG
jgi:hypothetical protein